MVKKKTNRGTVSSSLDKDLYKKIQHLAIEEECGANDLIEEGMRRVLRSRQRKALRKAAKEEK